MSKGGKCKCIFTALVVVLFFGISVIKGFAEISKEYDEFSEKTTYKSVFPYMDPWHTIAMAFIKKDNKFVSTIMQLSIQDNDWHFFAEHDLEMKIDGDIKKLNFAVARSRSRGTNKLYTFAIYELNNEIIKNIKDAEKITIRVYMKNVDNITWDVSALVLRDWKRLIKKSEILKQ